MMREGGAESALDAAARRLDRAISLLETRLDGKMTTAKAEVDGLIDLDRAKLASGAELNALPASGVTLALVAPSEARLPTPPVAPVTTMGPREGSCPLRSMR